MLPNSEPTKAADSLPTDTIASPESPVTEAADDHGLYLPTTDQDSGSLPIAQVFSRLLQAEHTLALALAQLLRFEFEAISQQQIQQLAELSQHKSHYLKQLQLQSQARLQWMEQQQLPLSQACLERPDFAADAALHTHWQQLADAYKVNQKLAATLSELVLQARKRTLKQLNILRGKQNDPHLYSAQGKAREIQSGQGYIQA